MIQAYASVIKLNKHSFNNGTYVCTCTLGGGKDSLKLQYIYGLFIAHKTVH